MHEKLQEIIDYTKEKIGLTDFHLKRHHIFREHENLKESSYLVNMEWFPNDSDQTSEDYNPAGTASIDIDIHTNRIKRILFVQDVTLADQENYPTPTTESTIEWIEELTDLEFGRQFKLVHNENGNFKFRAAVDNIIVYPIGTIEVQFNEDGKLTLFSIDGHFPNESQINWEPFSLLPETTDKFAKEQCTLLEIPVEGEEKWVSFYAIREMFITNKEKMMISFEEVEKQGKSYIQKDVILEWNYSPIDKKFSKREIDLSTEVTLEQALAIEPNPDALPLTTDDSEKVTEETRSFLQRIYPNDSGKWRLTALYRENGYIFAELKPTAADNRVIDRKIKLIIDKEINNVLNYIDNESLLDMFKHFQQAENPQLSQDTAFEKLRKYIEVTPVYVYNKEDGSYILCGKMDCAYGVDATTGDVVLLDEL